MEYIEVFIRGVPYSHAKSRGLKEAAPAWSEAIIEQTRNLPKVADACHLKATFRLPPDKFPKDFPYGPDLDNLLKRFLDALEKTVFSGSSGGDSCIISLTVLKAKVATIGDAGVHLEILPFTFAKSAV
jgi:Holliday junction resolvase RusA-like endonuclease